MRRTVPWLGTIGPALVLADALAVLGAGLVARAPLMPSLVAAVLAVCVAHAADLHRPRLVLSILEDLPALFVTAAAATVVQVVAGAAGLEYAVVAFACLVLAHTLVYAVSHLLRQTGRFSRRVLVLGTGPAGRRIGATLLDRHELGLRPVGFVATGPEPLLRQARGLPLALVGPVASLPRAMAESWVHAVVVAFDGPARDDEVAAVEGLLAAPADVYAVPTWFPQVRAHTRHPRELVGGVAVAHVYRRGTWLPVRVFKRVVEVLVGAVTLVALLPVFALLAVPVRIETGGVLVGLRRDDGRGGTVLVPRFRTRRAHAVARPGTTFAVSVPGRVGPVGTMLRRTGLVALPEVIRNLLRQVRYPGGVPGGVLLSAAASRADQAEVDAGQLAR